MSVGSAHTLLSPDSQISQLHLADSHLLADHLYGRHRRLLDTVIATISLLTDRILFYILILSSVQKSHNDVSGGLTTCVAGARGKPVGRGEETHVGLD